MKCPNCNFEVAENTKFCPECGTKIPEIVEATSSENVTEEIPNTPSTIETNEKKEAKKKKIKKIIIISVSALLACGIIFLVLYLVNPFCMFGHDMMQINRVEATCGAEGYEEHGCSKCDYIYRYTLSNYNLEHNWDTIPCGKENHCTTCGKTEILKHQLDTLEPKCIHCGKAKFTIILPQTPFNVSEYKSNGGYKTVGTITELQSNIYSSSNDVFIHYMITKDYDTNGSFSDSRVYFKWKLYNSKGVVVYSSIESSDSILVGEKSDGIISLYLSDAWEEYRLEFFNYN